MLRGMLLEILSKPGGLGLREKLDESRPSGACRGRNVLWERVKTATWPQLPEADDRRDRIGTSEDGPPPLCC